MGLKETLSEDLKAAMRAKDTVRRDTIRMLKSELEHLELKDELTRDAELQALTRALKMREEAAAAFREGGRPEQAAKEEAEGEVIRSYLPKPLEDAEAEEAMRALAAELGLDSPKQMGQLISAATQRYRGQLTGERAAKIARALLS